jgi:hypothetical protein
MKPNTGIMAPTHGTTLLTTRVTSMRLVMVNQYFTPDWNRRSEKRAWRAERRAGGGDTRRVMEGFTRVQSIGPLMWGLRV